MKRKIVIAAVIASLSFALSSCLDAIEYITIDKNRDIQISFMITVSKSLFAMGGEGESVEETFEKDILNPDEISGLIPGAKNVETHLIDSDVDYGYLFVFTLPRNYQPADDVPMTPRINWDSMEILLTMPNTEKEEKADTAQTNEIDEMAEAIFSSAKYKIQISKKVLEYSSKAYVKSADGEIINVDLVDLGDAYLVNLPLLMVMTSEKQTYLVFEF